MGGWLPKNSLHSISISDKLWRMDGWMDDVINVEYDRRKWRISNRAIVPYLILFSISFVFYFVFVI